MDGQQLTLGVLFLAGMLSFLSPCVLPVIPAYLSLISGLTFDQLQEAHAVRRARWRLLLSALAFVAGFGMVTMLMLGAFASLIQELPAGGQTAFRWIGGAVILVFALHMLGVLRIGVLFNDRRFQMTENKFGIPGAALMGAAFGFGWSPCIGPFLGGVLGMAGSASSAAEIWLLLGAYVVGLAVPFVLAALFVNLFLQSMSKLTRHMRAVEIAAGVLLLFMGVLLVTDNLSSISPSASSATGQWLMQLEQRLEEGIR